MKTKRGLIAAATLLFMATPFFGAMAVTTAKPHKVLLQNLTVASVDTTAKTITAHSGSGIIVQVVQNTTYTISYSKKTKLRRASGEKAPINEFLVNDSITIWGTTTDGTNVTASKIRDNSIRKIKGKFLATIVEFAPVGLQFPNGIQHEFLAVRNGNQAVVDLTYGYTKFKSGKRKITFADLQTGDVVQLQGITRTLTFGPSTTITQVYNTTQVTVKSHGAVPSFPLVPNFFKVVR